MFDHADAMRFAQRMDRARPVRKGSRGVNEPKKTMQSVVLINSFECISSKFYRFFVLELPPRPF